MVVDGELARLAALPQTVELFEGENGRSFYPSVPGSLLAEVPYEPLALFDRAVAALRPALMQGVRLAARRRAGRGVEAGHRQDAVRALAVLAGRPLPTPGYTSESAQDAAAGSLLMEGALQRVLNSQYERNATARRGHAMLHCHDPPMSINELQALMSRVSNA